VNSKCTEVYLVAYEALAKLVAEDMAEDAVVGLAPVLIDLVEQLSECSQSPKSSSLPPPSAR
jgi:hypothetical protein